MGRRAGSAGGWSPIAEADPVGQHAIAVRAVRRLLTLAAIGGLAAACASAEPDNLPQTRAGLDCVDDSRQCIDQRQSALRGLMSDRERRWVREPATPEAYASGVRLFAYKGRKKELSCEELAHGRREAEAAAGVLRGASGGRLTPAQVSRGTMLAAEVGRELGTEIKRRCRA